MITNPALVQRNRANGESFEMTPLRVGQFLGGRPLKAMLHGSTCNIDFPRNTVLRLRDMLHESTFCTTVIDFLIETYFTCYTGRFNATSIRNITLVTKKLETGKFEGETRNPLPTVISVWKIFR